MISPDVRRTLVHDVGKYIARTARNLPKSGPIPAVLLPMMLRDLYEGPASSRFAELVGEAEEPFLTTCRDAFLELDALEPQVRAGDEAAIRRAASLALVIERELRGALE